MRALYLAMLLGAVLLPMSGAQAAEGAQVEASPQQWLERLSARVAQVPVDNLL